MNDEMIKEIIEKATLYKNIGLFALIGTVLAFLGSMISIYYSYKSSKKSNEVSSNLGQLNASTLDKQRIIETIGIQRISWINDLRKHFVEFNDIIYSFQFSILSETSITSEYFRDLYLSVNRIINNIELYLNTEEKYSKKLVLYMKELDDDVINKRFDEIKRKKDLIIFMQQIILKSEWKRIKEETHLGEELAPGRMEEIVNELGLSWDENKHNYITE